mmetsp:Transcript_11384/g.17079  ORF Transcript_11384/g.17079 Transcript_11384/m.17079 type:complete len:82 (-) Transcript_11384:37-282(-)
MFSFDNPVCRLAIPDKNVVDSIDTDFVGREIKTAEAIDFDRTSRRESSIGLTTPLLLPSILNAAAGVMQPNNRPNNRKEIR